MWQLRVTKCNSFVDYKVWQNGLQSVSNYKVSRWITKSDRDCKVWRDYKVWRCNACPTPTFNWTIYYYLNISWNLMTRKNTYQTWINNIKSSESFFLFIGKYSWVVIITAIINITHPVITKPGKKTILLCWQLS